MWSVLQSTPSRNLNYHRTPKAQTNKGYEIHFFRKHITNLRVDLHILLGGEHVLLSLLNAIVEHILKDVDRLFAQKSINDVRMS